MGARNRVGIGLLYRAGICTHVKGWKIDSWNRLGNKFGIEVPMSHVHVIINFSYGINSWNRCLSVHKRQQIRALPTRVGNLSPAMGQGIDSRNWVWNWVTNLHRLAGQYDNPMPTWFLAPIAGLKLPVSEPVFVDVYGHLGIDSKNRFHMKNWLWRGHGTWAPRFQTYFLIDSRNRFFTP